MKKMPGYLVRRMHQLSTAIFAEEFAEYDLTAVQFAALVTINERVDFGAAQVAELISCDPATIGDVIARLERKGLLVRTPGVKDRRIKVLAPSPQGRRLIEVSSARLEKVQERLMAGLSPAERELLLSLLAKLIGAADAAEAVRGY